MKAEDLPKQEECPLDDGTLYLKNEPSTMDFRGEKYSYTRYWYECDKCGEMFSTEESDWVNLDQVYDQYRERYNIPSEKELIALRERCGLSAAKMSAMLGLGINQYRMYEGGAMPSLSEGRILYALCHSKATLNLYLRMFNPKDLDGRNKPVRKYTVEPEEALQQVAEPPIGERTSRSVHIK